MSLEDAQASVKANFMKLYGNAMGGKPKDRTGRVGFAYGPSSIPPVLEDFDEGFDDMEEIRRMLKQDQTGIQGTADIASGELDDLLQRLGMVVDGIGIYSDYNQNQRKQMQRSLTSRINVLLR